MQFKTDKQQKKEKPTKQDIEITKKAENNHKRHITGKKCASKNISGKTQKETKQNGECGKFQGRDLAWFTKV